METKDYLEEIREEIDYITAHEEDDEEWEKQGYEFLRNKEFDKAENKFKELTLSQPKHHGGHVGLAYLYYEIGEIDKALWFMEMAIEIAKGFLEDDAIDIEVIEEMKKNHDRMRNREELSKWWI